MFYGLCTMPYEYVCDWSLILMPVHILNNQLPYWMSPNVMISYSLTIWEYVKMMPIDGLLKWTWRMSNYMHRYTTQHNTNTFFLKVSLPFQLIKCLHVYHKMLLNFNKIWFVRYTIRIPMNITKSSKKVLNLDIMGIAFNNSSLNSFFKNFRKKQTFSVIISHST